MFNWDDLRFLIGVAEHGSLSGAARALRVDHATVGRRLSALEDSLSATLIDRQSHRCALTDAGQQVLSEALRMQDRAFAIQRVIELAGEAVDGTVVVSAPPVLVKNLLASASAQLRSQHPNVRLVLSGDAALVSLSKRQADVAIRLSRPTEHDIVARKVGEMKFGLYASAAYVASRDASDFEFIASTRKYAEASHERWLRTYAGSRSVALENDDISANLDAARSGVGVAALPCFIADPAPELVRVSAEQAMSREIWLLTHRDARRSRAIRAVAQFVAELLRAHGDLGYDGVRARFTGGAPGNVAESSALLSDHRGQQQ